MERLDFEQVTRERDWDIEGYEIVMSEPTLEQMMEWKQIWNGCYALDGCWVALDGVCPHGAPSWLLYLELI
jgi:hypothetical protein